MLTASTLVVVVLMMKWDNSREYDRSIVSLEMRIAAARKGEDDDGEIGNVNDDNDDAAGDVGDGIERT